MCIGRIVVAKLVKSFGRLADAAESLDDFRYTEACALHSHRTTKIGPAGFEPATKGLCVPTTAFAASFEFGVWTIPSLYVFAVWSLHLPLSKTVSGKSILAWLGINMPDSPVIWRVQRSLPRI